MPTRYVDFLNFLRNGGKEQSSHTEKSVHEDENVTSINASRDKTYSDCRKNMWYSYFIKIVDGLPKDKSWINFEEEIGKKVKDISPGQSKEWKTALDQFTDCLNYYFFHYVNTIPVDIRLPDICNNDFEYILSFNYTNTYERLYGKIFDPADTIKYSFVHGKAEQLSDLVLGCDNLLNDNFVNNDYYNSMVPFEKTFQRTEKSTDKSFAKWFSNIKEQFNLHVFGHSLGMTDKSILVDLILHPKSTVVVYYHSLDNRKELISNLIRMLGVENYNRKSPHITFQPQSKPITYTEEHQKHQFEKLFSCLDLNIAEFCELIAKAKQMRSNKGYPGILIKRFFEKYSFIEEFKRTLQDKSVDEYSRVAISGAPAVKYLKQVCTGSIEYKCEDLRKIRIFEAGKREVEEFVYDKDAVVKIRWENVKKMLNANQKYTIDM